MTPGYAKRLALARRAIEDLEAHLSFHQAEAAGVAVARAIKQLQTIQAWLDRKLEAGQ